jgi:hypothetical protein
VRGVVDLAVLHGVREQSGRRVRVNDGDRDARAVIAAAHIAVDTVRAPYLVRGL